MLSVKMGHFYTNKFCKILARKSSVNFIEAIFCMSDKSKSLSLLYIRFNKIKQKEAYYDLYTHTLPILQLISNILKKTCRRED